MKGRRTTLMTVRYAIYKELRLVISTASDRVTFADIKSHQDQLLNDPDFDPQFNQFIDMTAVTVIDISTQEAIVVAQRKIFSRTSRRAFVASSPEVFGVGRLMEAYNEMSDAKSEACVFSGVPSALKWLGLESLPQ
jgi:hypothetical protein